MRRPAVLFAFVICLLVPARASAHVVVRSEDQKNAAVFHLTPDDSPIAGELSNIYVGLQDPVFSDATHYFSLYVVDEGVQRNLPVDANGGTLSAFFIFPKQAAYELRLRAQPKAAGAAAADFTMPIRITRGLAGSPLNQKSYPAAEAGIVAAFVIAVLLAVLGFRLRKQIVRYSKQS